ncbi:hypothetical protein TNCV_2302561 [Trichonephila clavipes]|nr:hypothetical protein TNCV_2302561 [Trichonephila clavipes]
MAESLEAALWLDAGKVISDSDWLPSGLGFNKWRGASPVPLFSRKKQSLPPPIIMYNTQIPGLRKPNTLELSLIHT